MIFLSGCSTSSSAPLHSKNKNGELYPVLSTIAPVEILVSAIGGDKVNSECLITGELDPHSYQLVKGDREKFRRAKLIFYSGLGLEHDPSLAASLANSPQSVSVGCWLQKRSPHLILQSNGIPDPHVWMDIELWSQGLDLVCQKLSDALPQYKKEFFQRKNQLLISFQNMHKKVRSLIGKIPSHKRYLVTTHDAFRYFGRAYLAESSELCGEKWQERLMSPEGLAPESQISLQQMQSALKFITKHHVSHVFAESNVNQQSLAKIAQAAKAHGIDVTLAKEKLYGDSMPPYQVGNSGYHAYLTMIWSNAKTIVNCLAPETFDECDN